MQLYFNIRKLKIKTFDQFRKYLMTVTSQTLLEIQSDSNVEASRRTCVYNDKTGRKEVMEKYYQGLYEELIIRVFE